MSLHPSPSVEGAWSIDLPKSASREYISDVQTPFTATSIPHTLEITFKMKSDEALYDVPDAVEQLPATIRIFFEQQNFDFRNPNGRWWATSSYNLGSLDGEAIEFNVPFTPGQWTNANGEQDAQAFLAALSNVGSIGFAFGGHSPSARGVALRSGDAQFVLIDLKID